MNSKKILFFYIICIAIWIFLPMLNGEYGVPNAELLLLKIISQTHYDYLQQGKLFMWDNLTGNGHPGILLNYHPLGPTFLLFYIFGINDITFSIQLIIDLTFLVLGFVVLGARFQWNKWVAIPSALIYFSIGFVKSFFAFGFYNAIYWTQPWFLAFAVDAARTSKTNERNNKVYIYLILIIFLQLSGNSANFWFIGIIGDLLILLATFATININSIKNYRTWCKFGIIILVALILNAPQIYYVTDIISQSGRIKSELIVSPLSITAWKEFANSFLIFEDLYQALGHYELISCLLLQVLYLIIQQKNINKISILGVVFAFLIPALFLYQENAGGGYEYVFFQQFPIWLRLPILCAIQTSLIWRSSSVNVRIALFILIGLWFLRAHLQILLLRFTALVWHITRDDHLSSIAFAILIAEVISSIILKMKYKKIQIGFIFNIIFHIIIIINTKNQFYYSKIHNFINRVNLLKESEFERIGKDIKERFNSEGWFRFAQFGMNYDYRSIPGSFRFFAVPESSIYDNSVNKYYRNFHYNLIYEGKFKKRDDITEFLPYPYFPLNVHRALNIANAELLQESYFRNALTLDFPYDDRVQFLWDLTQTKYILKYGSPIESNYLEKINYYNEFNVALYRNKNINSSRFGFADISILNESNSEYFDKVKTAFLNTRPATSDDIKILIDNIDNFKLLVNTKKQLLLINYETWNPNWNVTINGQPAEIYRVFHFLRAVQIPPGHNEINFKYENKLFECILIFVLFIWIIIIFLLSKYLLKKYLYLKE